MGINAIVGQSGGPTCVINSSLAGVFSACRMHGVQKVFGMRHGVQGLLKDEVIDLTEALDKAADDRARGVILRRLKRALEGID